MKIANKNILMVGLGKTGVATARFLTRRGAVVTGTDSAKEHELTPVIQSLTDLGVHLRIGYHAPESFENADLIIISPGVPHTMAPIKKAMDKGVPVIGEIELASMFIEEPIIAVTGTNGKTTTTTLIGEMLKQCGYKVFVGGNIGNPLIDYADTPEKADVVVAEISSFQLDTIETFRPAIGVLLNIADDHLDRYESFNAYARSKCRLFENQKSKDTAVLNGSDPIIQKLCNNIQGKKLFYTASEGSDISTSWGTAHISNTDIHFKIGEKEHPPMDITGMHLTGIHNIENVAAASLAALTFGGSLADIQAAANSFKGLPHRLEYVDTENDVKYYNDSKATNVDAVEKALHAFTVPVVLIMGGRNKDIDFHLLKDSVRARVKKLIVIGEASEEILFALGHLTDTDSASSMNEAVMKSYQTAGPGEVVLLSPACASFDMYNNYAERGDDFRQAVKNLTKQN